MLAYVRRLLFRIRPPRGTYVSIGSVFVLLNLCAAYVGEYLCLFRVLWIISSVTYRHWGEKYMNFDVQIVTT